MKTVYKYQVQPGVTDGIEAAGLIRVIHVAPDYSDTYKEDVSFGLPITPEYTINSERVTFWAEVDTEINYKIPVYIVSTGHLVPPGNIHCGTAVMPSGLVWHLYIPKWCFRIEG